MTAAGPEVEAPPHLEFLFRDEQLLAVNKPSGMIVHRGSGRDEVVVMKVARDMIGQWVYPLHRLDRGTSGVLVFGLSSEVAATVNRSFETGQVRKRYLALVRGVTPDQGTIDHPVPNKENGQRVPAVTHYRRLGVFERFSLVEARPETGRYHQIRRHLKHISHPLVGDVKYGKGEINRMFRARFGLHRLALHALAIELPHPISGEPVVITAGLPADLAEPLEAMALRAAAEAAGGSRKGHVPLADLS